MLVLEEEEEEELEVVLGAVDRVPDEIHVALRGENGAPVRLVYELAGNGTHGAEIQTPNGNQVFSVVCNLQSGYHQYKFIVDEWRHDENQAFIQDPLGNVNNWLFMKKPSDRRRGGGNSAVSSPAEVGSGSGIRRDKARRRVEAYIQQQQMMQQQQNYQQGTAPLEVPGMMSPESSGMVTPVLLWWTTSASVASPTSTRQIATAVDESG